ncbi:hypothetical protein Mapa_005326 [Marchantia paleacea]|nr:hypothetical protein Mapa_005326 [Marchantia paleacea]
MSRAIYEVYILKLSIKRTTRHTVITLAFTLHTHDTLYMKSRISDHDITQPQSQFLPFDRDFQNIVVCHGAIAVKKGAKYHYTS